jgi:hypothetical protein
MKLDMRIQADLTGWVGSELARGAVAVTNVVRRTTRKIEKNLEAAIAEGGLGRLARAMQSKVYPDQPSLGAAGLIWAKGKNTPRVLEAFATGATIRTRADGDATFLAIPTEAAPKRGRDGKRIEPDNWPNERYGRLRFVYRRSGPSLLVVDDLRARRGKSGGYSRNVRKAKTGETKVRATGSATVVMFVLVKQVRLRKRFDFEGTVRAGLEEMPGLIVGAWQGGG